MVVISGYRIGNLRQKCDLAGHIYCTDVTCRITPSTILQIYNLDGEKMEQEGMRQFYIDYPKFQSLTGELTWAHL